MANANGYPVSPEEAAAALATEVAADQINHDFDSGTFSEVPSAYEVTAVPEEADPYRAELARIALRTQEARGMQRKGAGMPALSEAAVHAWYVDHMPRLASKDYAEAA